MIFDFEFKTIGSSEIAQDVLFIERARALSGREKAPARARAKELKATREGVDYSEGLVIAGGESVVQEARDREQYYERLTGDDREATVCQRGGSRQGRQRGIRRRRRLFVRSQFKAHCACAINRILSRVSPVCAKKLLREHKDGKRKRVNIVHVFDRLGRASQEVERQGVGSRDRD
jgi:hypothetical protein